jgi:hypothetical protein
MFAVYQICDALYWSPLFPLYPFSAVMPVDDEYIRAGNTACTKRLSFFDMNCITHVMHGRLVFPCQHVCKYLLAFSSPSLSPSDAPLIPTKKKSLASFLTRFFFFPSRGMRY